MINEVSFYQYEEILPKVLSPLATKIIADNKKAIIFSTSVEVIKQIDDGLWSYGRIKFVPHITIFDIEQFSKFEPTEQPIFITNKNDNFNKADYLILVEDFYDEVYLSKFSRIFYFYNTLERSKIENIAKKFIAKKIKVNNFRQIEGKWVSSVV